MVTAVVEFPDLRKTPASHVLRQAHRYLPVEAWCCRITSESTRPEMFRNDLLYQQKGRGHIGLCSSAVIDCLLRQDRTRAVHQQTYSVAARTPHFRPDLSATLSREQIRAAGDEESAFAASRSVGMPELSGFKFDLADESFQRGSGSTVSWTKTSVSFFRRVSVSRAGAENAAQRVVAFVAGIFVQRIGCRLERIFNRP
jgi:hypothetical protein